MLKLNDNTLAIICILIGMTVFSLQDVLIRILSEEISAFQILFIRSIVGTSLLCIYLKFNKIPIIFSSHYPILTILRAAIFLLGFTLFYVALANLPFAIATSLFFTSPFFVTVLSKFFLKEDIGIRRWLTVGFGFIGVIIIVNPTLDGFNYYMLMPVICALTYASAMIMIKKTSDKDSVYSQTFHFYLMAMILCPIFSLLGIVFGFQNIESRTFDFIFRSWDFSLNNNMLIMILIGVTAVVAFVFTLNAYRLGKPFIVAPFEYILLVWAIIYGRLIWGEVISLQSYVGISIIVIGGIYIFYREKINEQSLSIDTPLR